MAYIKTIPEDQATGEVSQMYEEDRKRRGYVPNYAKIFSLRPAVKFAWNKLLESIRKEMDERRYELITVAAARALRSSYCMLAHGSVLRNKFYNDEQVVSIAKDFRAADLSPAEVVMMSFAEKVVRDATAVTQADIDGLRKHGFSDPEIFDITATATARSFFSKTLDALGAEPDVSYMDLQGPVRAALTVGRPTNV